jgi:hypothetical protein
MRFPDIDIMWRVFDLFRNRLEIEDKLIPYEMSSGNEFVEYNARRLQRKEIIRGVDNFWDTVEKGGTVDERYVQKGSDYWLNECYIPFKTLLVKHWKEGTKSEAWKTFMEFDKYSMRVFMLTAFDVKLEEGIYLKKHAYSIPAVDWLERMDAATGWFDMAFTEMVLHNLEFDYPKGASFMYGADDARDSGVNWFCLA